MGGSSKQVVGYRYFANFLLFIGNPIEKVLGINFDKRGWETGKRVPMGTNGELCYLHLPNLYGENEGGVSGVLNIKHGSKIQTVDSAYTKYMNSISLPASAYPYQSYISFSGSELASQFQGMTDEELQDLADEYEDGIVPGKGFYVGNSGYMKEMLLWVKRTRVRNDGREQWYKVRGDGVIVCEIGAIWINAAAFESAVLPRLYIPSTHYTEFDGEKSQTDSETYFNGSLLNSGIGTVTIGGRLSKHLKSQALRRFESRIFKKDDVWEIRGTAIYTGDLTLNFDGLTIFSNNDISTSRHWMAEFTGYIIVKQDGVLEVEGGCDGNYFSDLNAIANVHTFSVSFELRLSTKPYIQINTEHPDINPIHKIREILTDDTAMGKPESDVNDINFMKAADRIWNEGLGISWSITEKSCLEAIEELCGHIEAGVRVNRQTGLYEMVLFRDDWFEENEIYTIAVNKIKSMSLEVANADEAINQLNVTYYNRGAIKDSSFSIAENASIRNLNGRVNAQDADFPYFMNQRNAAIVAQWKLKQMSSPIWKGSFTTAEYNARKWNRYDLLKLSWPRKWQGTITVRIMKINLGTGADVSIDFVEVTPYSSNLSSDIVIDEPIDVGVQPPLACPYEPFEMPYYLAVMALGQRQVDEELSYENNFGLVGVVAQQPQSNSLYAVMMTHDGTEGEEWLRAATINYEPTAELDQIISKTSTSFTVKNSAAISGLLIGTLIKCGSDWIGTPGEWMVFQGVDAYTGVVSVKRGALDSLPQDWGMGTKLYFCGSDVAFDSTEYVAGEEVLVSVLTTTPSGMLEQEGSIATEMNARAFRPYPPANVKFNGNYFPETIVVTNDIVLTWVDRNRLQQTGGATLGFFDTGVTAESGVTYSYELISENFVLDSGVNIELNTATIAASALVPNKPHTLKLWSVRDGYASYQIFEHSFFAESASLILAASIDDSGVAGNTVPAANITVDVDTSLKANMQFNGSGISGKAIPGAVITIEVDD
ncbi:phage tail protein [Acinetobacter sp. YH12218]|uniref:phage tail protein n=1 Tax=Acinetobacter sp. YH12218 TaxID=2601152 RepID=UPI0015D15DD8|nr:phage tail protein [Acinetobacter sp. YH12218]